MPGVLQIPREGKMNKLDTAFASLFETNMAVRPAERIVVFSDIIRPDETPSSVDADRRQRLLEVAEKGAAIAGSRYGNATFVSFPATQASGAEPPEILWKTVLGNGPVERLAMEGILQRLLVKEGTAQDLERARELVLAAAEGVADVVIALSNNSTSHTRFRSLVNLAGGRFASLPNFDPDMFFSSMMVDWQALAERTARLADYVNSGTELRLETPKGTRMNFGKSCRIGKGHDGLLSKPGSFGNLPAGEVYLAPMEGTSSGVMVIEYAPARKLASPLRLVVEKGIVTEIHGDEPYRLKLEQKFAESPANRNIAELGIGTNDKATRPDNILR